MNGKIISSLLLLTIACGKAPKMREFNSQLPANRIESLTLMTSDETKKEINFPLVSKSEVIALNGVINQKLLSGSPASEVAPLLKILLNGIRFNWVKEDKSRLLPSLETFASYDESLKNLVDEFLMVEGLKQRFATADEEFAVTNVLKAAVDSKQFSDQTELPETFKLPLISWTGTMSTSVDGENDTRQMDVSGIRFGSVSEKAEGHAFITPNVTSANKNSHSDSILSIHTELKSPKDGWFRTKKKAMASFTALGSTEIPACLDLLNCSPIVALRLKTLSQDLDIGIEITVNGTKVDSKNLILINRGSRSVSLKIKIKGSKVAEYENMLNERYELMVSLTQDSSLTLKNWATSYEVEIDKLLKKGLAQAFMNSQLSLLDKLSKKDSQTDEVINGMKNFIKSKSDKILKQTLAEKQELIHLIPDLREVTAALTDFDKANHIALSLDAKLRDSVQISNEDIDLATQRPYLRASFCKRLNSAIYSLHWLLTNEIKDLSGLL